jgi:plasmid maintenance system antidote protein VapI
LAREDIIEDFLHATDREMRTKKISRAELARRIGCNRSTVTRIMNRSRKLTIEWMVAIAESLGVEIKIEVVTQ